MTEIKTAQAWSRYDTIGGLIVATTDRSRDFMYDSCVIVHGLTEAEVHEAAALLEKSREVCEWYPSDTQDNTTDFCPATCDTEWLIYKPNFCPSCGRKVVVKDD